MLFNLSVSYGVLGRLALLLAVLSCVLLSSGTAHANDIGKYDSCSVVRARLQLAARVSSLAGNFRNFKLTNVYQSYDRQNYYERIRLTMLFE